MRRARVWAVMSSSRLENRQTSRFVSGCIGRQLARMDCWGGARGAEVGFDRTMGRGWPGCRLGDSCDRSEVTAALAGEGIEAEDAGQQVGTLLLLPRFSGHEMKGILRTCEVRRVHGKKTKKVHSGIQARSRGLMRQG